MSKDMKRACQALHSHIELFLQATCMYCSSQHHGTAVNVTATAHHQRQEGKGVGHAVCDAQDGLRPDVVLVLFHQHNR